MLTKVPVWAGMDSVIGCGPFALYAGPCLRWRKHGWERFQHLEARVMDLSHSLPLTQVLSPLSDSMLAEKTVTVLDDKVSVTDLAIQLVAGLSVTLRPSTENSKAVTAVATAEELLRTPKQVGAGMPEVEGSRAGCCS